MCTCTMDKLGEQSYGDPYLLKKFSVDMVDDIISESICGADVVYKMQIKEAPTQRDKCTNYILGNPSENNALHYW